MAKVNLLPEEMITKTRGFELPIFPILFYVYLVLVVILVLILASNAKMKKSIDDIKLDMQTVQVKSREAGQIKKNMATLDSFFGGVIFSKIIPPYALTDILSEINQNIPDGLWLKSLEFASHQSDVNLKLEGFIKPVSSKTMISQVGSFNAELKEAFEDLAEKSQEDLKKYGFGVQQNEVLIDFETNTKRRKADKIEITEFSTEFEL